MLEFLLWIIAIYLFFRILIRWVFPWLVRRNVRKFQERFYDQNPHMRDRMHEEEEGETEVKTPPAKDRKLSDDAGDYIDYEEIN